jgi:hypothetical protein
MSGQDRIELDRIVFMGRTYQEYMSMFDLDESMLRHGRVLDCAAGPSSFTAEANKSGMTVAASDILYNVPFGALAEKGRQDIEEVYQKMDDAPGLFVWKYYKNRNHACKLRHDALNNFLQDFPEGIREGRYVHAELPRLPFADQTFSLVLSSHFLFLYGDRLNIDFHIASLKEMARVSSGEVRVYPLQGLDAKPYSHMDEVLSCLRAQGIHAELVPTPFEFQRGANRMLKLNRKLC